MIHVTNLTKVFPGVVAVNDISFRVEKGDVIGFLGPNGAGKTTTMRMLTCFLPPTSGSVTVAGFDAVRDSLAVRRRIGYLPESNPLYPEMRVTEYLTYRATLKKVPRNERRQRVADALDRCGLGEMRTRIIGHLSKGFRQRVGLADAIVHDPEIVILDEPTIGLDPNQNRQVRELIRDLGEKRTVILSTHILSEVEVMCRKAVIISGGKIAASGSLEEIKGRLRRSGRFRAEIKGDASIIRKKLEKLEGVKNVTHEVSGDPHVFTIEANEGRDVREDVYRTCAANLWTLCELASDRVSLEDAFVELTQHRQEGN